MKAFWVEQQAHCRTLPAFGDPPPWLAVQVARSFVERARGLLGRPEPSPGCGLLLLNVNTVHGFGMRHALDLLFLDRRGIIVGFKTLAPAAVARCGHAQHVLELRAGEATRLGLQRDMRPCLLAVEDIFGECAGVLAARARSGSARPMEDLPETGLRPATRILASLLAVILLTALPVPASGRPDDLGPLSLVRPVSPQTLQQLEEEAEALYRREGSTAAIITETVRRYESLAELSAQRAPHAWLRIGNLYQRAGSIGNAIDAYRRARSADATQSAATTAERKALLNLAALALDQARQSLTRLAVLPAADGVEVAGPAEQVRAYAAGSRAADREPVTPVPADVTLQGQVESLQLQLRRQLERQSPSLGAQTAADPSHRPYVVERYTASARRNRVRVARGSLHVHPADQLPAAPVARSPPRAVPAPLPSVEYLLGDPHRAEKAEGAKPAGKQTGGTNRSERSR